ncbi:MAG: excinuclease ABC subunit UvrC [Candidatus Omnitrophota bacterium]
MNLKEKIKTLPDGPGVYLMKDVSDKIIYIGKASSLKKRVSSYFTSSVKTIKQQALVCKINDLDFVTTCSEAEALILEAGLIKEHRPKYNTAIKDDKSYPLLKLTIRENFPRLLVVRRKKNDGARYFGPYTSARLLHQALAFMRRIFPLRTCKVMPGSLCLNYHLKQCLGPCIGSVTKKEYDRVVDNVLLFLQGKKAILMKKLLQEMSQASQLHNFEEAARLRDEIESLSSVSRFPHSRIAGGSPLEELQNILRLKRLPDIIEGFDISNVSGAEAVGSMVRFKNGYAQKDKYRRFRIKTVRGINDYAMIKEVVTRRYQGRLRDDLELPDLILIDGGKGHLECAGSALLKSGVSIPIISIAKRFEHIYVQWQGKPLALARRSKALLLIMRIRDEAHRFAVSYHRVLRKREMLLSALDQIPGIGPKKRKLLREFFNNPTALKRLTTVKLTQIRGIDAKTAKNIVEYWKKY